MLALVLGLVFVCAALVPPCPAHLAEFGGGGMAVALASDTGHDTDHTTSPTAGHADHGQTHDDVCTCAGDCRHALSAARVLPAPLQEAAVAAVVIRSRVDAPVVGVTIARLHLPHVLPISTAPPTALH